MPWPFSPGLRTEDGAHPQKMEHSHRLFSTPEQTQTRRNKHVSSNFPNPLFPAPADNKRDVRCLNSPDLWTARWMRVFSSSHHLGPSRYFPPTYSAFQQFSSSLAALLFSFPSLPRRAAAAERVKHSDSRLRDPEKKE